MTVSTFYPDAHVESGSVDGVLYYYNYIWGGGTWAAQHDASTAHDIADDGNDIQGPRLNTGTTTNKWALLYRAIALFETASLPDGDAISAANISLTCNDVLNTLTGQSINIVSSAPASTDAIVVGDYDSFGTTKFVDTPLTIDTIAGGTLAQDGSATRHTMTLNSSGIANISKTGASKFGFRITSDIDDSEPTWVSGSPYGKGASAPLNFSEGHADDRIKLTVTHAATTDIETISGIAIADIEAINGIATSSIQAFNEVANL